MRDSEFRDEVGRLIDPGTGEIRDGERTLRARLKGPGAVKTDKSGDIESDVTFTVTGPRDALQDLMDPITALMSESAAGTLFEVRVSPVVTQKRLL